MIGGISYGKARDYGSRCNRGIHLTVRMFSRYFWRDLSQVTQVYLCALSHSGGLALRTKNPFILTLFLSGDSILNVFCYFGR